MGAQGSHAGHVPRPDPQGHPGRGQAVVRDRETLEPAAAEASYLANRVRNHGILLSTDGPLENVIKIKPPLCFDRADADRVIEELDRVLREDFLTL
jgi:4-aminobutyrate aminotransferase-like enzyme